MRVVILGCAPRSFEHPDDAEVWVINGPRLPQRWDRLFQLHGIDHIEHKHGAAYLYELAQIQPPRRLYMTRDYREPLTGPGWFLPRGIPAAEALPIGRIKEQASDYLTNSFPIAIAWAVMEGATEIILDGVMWSGGSAQWGAGEGWAVPCVEYHLGRAAALGVKVRVPPGCGLFANSSFVYGFEGPGSI